MEQASVNTFDKDKHEAKAIETFVAETVAGKSGNGWTSAPDERFPGYDFKIDFRNEPVAYWEERYEVKWDKESMRTGNFAVECYCNEQPSGIFTSRSDFYVFVNGNKGYIVERNRVLLEFAVALKKVFPKADIRWMGHGKKVRGWCVPIKTVEKWATEIITLPIPNV